MSDPLHPINEAEKLIEKRKMERESLQRDFREAIALETIADDLTRVHAELRTLRYLFATFAARPGR